MNATLGFEYLLRLHPQMIVLVSADLKRPTPAILDLINVHQSIRF